MCFGEVIIFFVVVGIAEKAECNDFRLRISYPEMAQRPPLLSLQVLSVCDPGCCYFN